MLVLLVNLLNMKKLKQFMPKPRAKLKCSEATKIQRLFSFESTFSFLVLKIPNISFFCKVYLKSRVDWPRIDEDIFNHNWSVVYNSPNSVSELNRVITFLINRRVPSKIIRRKVNDNENCVNAFHDKQNAYRI